MSEIKEVVDVTEAVQNRLNAAREVEIDLSQFGSTLEMGTVSIGPHVRRLEITNKVGSVYLRKRADGRVQGMFDRTSSNFLDNRPDTDCTVMVERTDNNEFVVDANGQAGGFVDIRARDSAGPLSVCRTMNVYGIGFRGFRSSVVRSNNCLNSHVNECTFTHCGKGHTIVNGPVDMPMKATTSRCLFDNCWAPTGQSAPDDMKNAGRNHPGEVVVENCTSIRQRGQWKIHGVHAFQAHNTHIAGLEGNKYPGLRIPGKQCLPYVFIDGCMFHDFDHGIEVQPGDNSSLQRPVVIKDTAFYTRKAGIFATKRDQVFHTGCESFDSPLFTEANVVRATEL